MDMLDQNASLKKTYAGGFVQSINGIRCLVNDSGEVDWFYYVNGLLAHIGVKMYIPSLGDIAWWDYHPWNERQMFPSVIGVFPQPFLNGLFLSHYQIMKLLNFPYFYEI
jgi:hypothetical protein